VQRQLNQSCCRTCRCSLVGDIAEVCIGNTVVRIVIAGNIHEVEEVRTESDQLSFRDVEVDTSVTNDELAILVGTSLAEGIRIALPRRIDGDRESGIRDNRT
jgi:hypothetical protein